MRGFDTGWWSFDLGKYRPCDGTYQLYPADGVPPLDEALFDGSFAWLGAKSAPKPSVAVRELMGDVERLGARLPAPFVRFMSDTALLAAVPSCTACAWDLSEEPVASKARPGESTIRFLRDQQDCLFWYLVVGGPDDGKVVCSPIPFDDPELDVSDDEVFDNTWIVAPHFEAFVYRFWLENVLWDLTGDGAKRTPEQQRYLDFYAKQPRA